MPNETIDPILIAAHFIVDVQSVVSREKDPAAFGVVTIGAISAGSAGNIIPDHAELRGTIRTFDNGARVKILEGVRRTAEAASAMAGAPPPVVNLTANGKSVYNDPALTARTAAVFQAAFGDKAFVEAAPTPTSEDFSEFDQRFPGCDDVAGFLFRRFLCCGLRLVVDARVCVRCCSGSGSILQQW
jgi:hippurate hydrolase